MQFQVPQFIETEDKVVGPLTLRQFGYVAAAAIISVFLFMILETALWLIITVLLGGVSIVMAFAKVNGRPISVFLKALFDSIWSPRIYVFKPTVTEAESYQVEESFKKEGVGLLEKLAFRQKGRGGSETTVATKKSERPAPVSRVRAEAPTFDGIKGLRERLATSKHAIPRREKTLPGDFGMSLQKFKERYEVVRHVSGDQEIAKRVDYR